MSAGVTRRLSAQSAIWPLPKAIHAILARFRDALRIYEAAMGEEMLAADVGPALLAAGLPRVHASAIGARAERDASHNALLTRWSAYQVATAVLTHEVGPRVSPERARGFERVAGGLLLSSRAIGPLRCTVEVTRMAGNRLVSLAAPTAESIETTNTFMKERSIRG